MLRVSRFLAVAAAVLCAGAVQAQGVLAFDATDHDFGALNEGDKPAYTFGFTNVGDRPLTLTTVQPSCGCTSPSYSTEPVGPGERGEVVVEYNSQGRPGDFHKSIAVQADGAEPAGVTLHISGTVVPKDLQNAIAQGNVAFDSDLHEYPALKADEPANHVFRMQNVGERPIRIQEATAYGEGVEVTFPDRPVFPEEIVEIAVRVPDVRAVLNARGQLDVAVTLVTDDALQPTKSLRLRGRLAADDASGATTAAGGTE